MLVVRRALGWCKARGAALHCLQESHLNDEESEERFTAQLRELCPGWVAVLGRAGSAAAGGTVLLFTGERDASGRTLVPADGRARATWRWSGRC